MSIETNDFNYLRDLIRDKSGIVLDDGKEYLVESRLLPLARDEGLNSIADIVLELRKQPRGNNLLLKVVDAMTTNESSFFRDINPFDSLREKVIPELIEKRSEKRTLNIWCAACSSGQEPYSIAITLREYFPQLADWDIRILATDISSAMLEQTKAGRYSQLEVNRGLPAKLMIKYFKKENGHWFVKPELTNMIDPQHFNLIAPWQTLPKMDLVFMRNVLIYFDQDIKAEILKKLHRVLCQDGYLFLGGAETTINLDSTFERISLGKSSCYCIADNEAMASKTLGLSVAGAN